MSKSKSGRREGSATRTVMTGGAPRSAAKIDLWQHPQRTRGRQSVIAVRQETPGMQSGNAYHRCAATEMKKKLSQARRPASALTKRGRLSPLEVFQRRMEHYDALACDEIALGDLGSREKTGEYSQTGAGGR